MSTLKRVILEMGTGHDVVNKDYTKAAIRAVKDAMQHSLLPLFGSLKIDPAVMHIELHLASQKPEAIDLKAVAATVPYGTVTPKAIFGGLDVYDHDNKRTSVIVNAGLIVRLPMKTQVS